MSAPLTTQRIGSRVCPGCEKQLAGHPGNLVDVEGTEPVRNRYGGFSDGRVRPVTRRWHEQCLLDFEAANQAYREQCAEDRREMIAAIGQAAGWSEDRIAAEVAKVTA
jgi:hypothetical protein